MARNDFDPKHARQQGADALKMTKDADNPQVFTALDCPYGPGDARDAWLAGFGGAKEEVRQVDTSTATTDDVRREPAKVVRKAAKASGSKRGGRGGKKGQPKTSVETRTTGTGETAVETHVATDANASAGTGIDATVGDPRGTEGDKTTISKQDVM